MPSDLETLGQQIVGVLAMPGDLETQARIRALAPGGPLEPVQSRPTVNGEAMVPAAARGVPGDGASCVMPRRGRAQFDATMPPM